VCVCVCSCAGKRYSSAPLDARYRCISVPRCFSGEAGCSRTLSCLREERKHAVSKDAMSSLKKLQSSQLLCTLLSLFPTPSHRHHIFTSSQCPLNCLPPLLSPSRSLCLVTHTQRKNLQRSTKRNRSTTGFVHALRFRHPTGVIAGDCPPFPSSSRLARVNDLFFFISSSLFSSSQEGSQRQLTTSCSVHREHLSLKCNPSLRTFFFFF
jgi:hypothetical protein